MAFYSFSRSNVALPAITDDLLTIITATARMFEVTEVSLGGLGTASNAGELQVARSTGGATGGGALVGRPLRENSAVFGGTNFTTWSTQPTLGVVLLLIPVNANGGLYRWVRVPGVNVLFNDDDTEAQCSFRPSVTGPTVSFHTIVEEW